jgi:hypothetical protein
MQHVELLGTGTGCVAGTALAYFAHLKALFPTTALAAALLYGQSLEVLVHGAPELTANVQQLHRCLHKVTTQPLHVTCRSTSSQQQQQGRSRLLLLTS